MRARPDSWFVAGSLVEVDGDPGDVIVVATGVRVCENSRAEARPSGEVYIDEEACNISEFEPLRCRAVPDSVNG